MSGTNLVFVPLSPRKYAEGKAGGGRVWQGQCVGKEGSSRKKVGTLFASTNTCVKTRSGAVSPKRVVEAWNGGEW